MRTKQSTGFTLVEIMIIAPIVILFIGAFISLIVNLTGDSLRLREKNAAAYNVQEALNEIETNVAFASSFQVSTANVVSPQGKNSSAANFTNTAAGESDTLIMKAAATTKNPTDPTRSLIYTGSGACNARNVVYQYYTIFFVSNGSLYKRTILPQQAACAVPWQRGSCAENVVAANPTICKRKDDKLLENVSALNIDYFSDASSSSPIDDADAADASSVSVSIGLSKSVAGEGLEYTGGSRVTSLNAQASDTVTEAPPAPQVTWTSASATPYTTTFQWDSLGNATGYDVRYRIDGGAWVNGPQNTTATSYNVVATHRKQTVEAEITALTGAGNYVYGTASRTIPRWEECALQNGWQNYGGTYAEAGFTKTSSNVVGLRGLVRLGTIGSSTPVCTLPVGFRPNQHLIFQVGGYNTVGGVGVSGDARVDIAVDGRVQVLVGENPWVSISGITFVADSASYAWTNGSWLNGWTNYGGAHAILRHTVDSMGRVQVEGLGRPGTLTSGTVMTNMLTPASLQPSHFIHMPSRSGTESAVSFGAGGAISTRGIGSGYNAVNFMYYPSTFNSWTTLSLTNGWVNYNSTTYSPAQCYKAADDVVVIRGLIKSGANGISTGVLNSIGCGAHADGRLLLHGWHASNNAARVDLLETGQLTFSVSSPTWTSIDNLRFIAD